MSREERQKLLASRKEEKDYEVFSELPFWRNGAGITNLKRSRLYLYHAVEKVMEPLTEAKYQLEGYDLSQDKKKLVYCGSDFQGVESLKQEWLKSILQPKRKTYWFHWQAGTFTMLYMLGKRLW